MKYRKLRIAWSVVWGVMAVLLIVLWTRSYRVGDAIRCNPAYSRGVAIGSASGQLTWATFDINKYPSITLGHESYLLDHIDFHTTKWGFSTSHELYYTTRTVSHWLLVVPLAAIAAAPWIRWRFSLRTLLIATTLVAVGLGLIVWLR
jgi:hypothetical protein